MAIDTAVKRASVIGYCTGLVPLRVPNTIDSAEERANIVHLYAGIAAAEAANTASDTDRRRRAVQVWQRLYGGMNNRGD